MSKPSPKQSVRNEIEIPEVVKRELLLCIIGLQPLIYNRMSLKAQQTLLFPHKSKRGKDQSEEGIKHNPYEEYRNSFYIASAGPTLMKLPVSAIKNALETAALDTEGVAKSEVGRCIWMGWEDAPVWGNPQLFMTGVRMAGINKTPDIRTRGVLREWATKITLNFAEDKFTVKTISSLLSRAGLLSGIGDFRQEKGAGSFGQFMIVPENDKNYLRIIAKYGREYQTAKYNKPEFFDDESDQLYTWWEKTYTDTFSAKPKHLRTVA
ncbi:MAG: hypothetical protein ACYDBH_00955 [Acidobacteriaceae bacterium]